MSNFESFFRRCPNCGRRFEIRLVGKKLVESESIEEQRTIDSTNRGYFGGYARSPLEVEETVPTYVEIEKFQYAYKCKHCGHQWVEIREKEHKEA